MNHIHVYRTNDFKENVYNMFLTKSPFSQMSLHQPENSSGPTDQRLLKLGGPCQNQVVSDQRTTANVET
jgi:hypothetical protein